MANLSGSFQELSPEVMQWLQQFAGANAAGQQAPAPPMGAAAQPVQTPFYTNLPQPGILDVLKSYFMPSTQSLAGGALQPAAPTAEGLAQRNRALGGGN